MPDELRPTLAQIAKAAKLNVSTVSRALHHHPSIPLKTREKIESIARGIGYSPDPMLSALAQYRNRKRKHSTTSVLGYLVDVELNTLWPYRDHEHLFLGAQNRAAEYGFKFEIISMREQGMNPKRVSQVLLTRGIRGILIGPSLGAQTFDMELEWKNFAVIALGHSFTNPYIHRVSDDYSFGMTEVLNHVYARGYKNPALVISRWKHERSNHFWMSAFLMDSYERFGQLKPSLIFEHSQKLPRKQVFFSWWDKLEPKPDCLIFVDAEQVGLFLESSGWKFPQTVGVAILNKKMPEEPFCGIQANHYQLGEIAASLLVDHYQRHVFGLSKTPQSLMVRGIWSDGRSLKRAE